MSGELRCPWGDENEIFEQFSKSDLETGFADFLEAKHGADIEAILEDGAQIGSRQYSVEFSVVELLHFDLALGTLLLHHPQKFIGRDLDLGKLGPLARALDGHDPEAAGGCKCRACKAAGADDGSTAAATEPERGLFDEAIVKAQERVHDVRQSMFDVIKPAYLVHARPRNLPQCGELWKPTVSSIRSADLNRLLSVKGTVIRTGQVKMLHSERTYTCAKCGGHFKVLADMAQRHQMAMPPECAAENLGPKKCGGTKFDVRELDDHGQPLTKCNDYQEVRIQEQVHRLTVGSIPRSITIVLQDDLVDRCKAGDDVTIVGLLRKRWKPPQRDQRVEVEMAIEAASLRVHNEERGTDAVREDLAADFAQYWSEHANESLRARDWLLRCLCPGLADLYIVKLALALCLIGGVGNIDRTGMRTRGEAHMLLVGDAGTGKSQVLRYAAKLSSRAVLTTGMGSTSAGLTCTAVRDPGGEWMLEAGALVLADGGLCCIDEFASIREHDRASIHEAMEQQTLSVAKAGLVSKLRTRCSIFAACNPKGGRFDAETDVGTNIGLPSPLLSRFDVVLVLRDQHDEARDMRIAQHIMRDDARSRVEVPAEMRGATDEWEQWPLPKLRAYFEWRKQPDGFDGSLSSTDPDNPDGLRPAGRLLNTYFLLQRNAEQRDAGRTTTRLLESLIRLAQAHAKLVNRATVEVQDAVYAILVTECSAATSKILGPINALHSTFPLHPEAEYQDLRRNMLEKLGLDDECRPKHGGGAQGYAATFGPSGGVSRGSQSQATL